MLKSRGGQVYFHLAKLTAMPKLALAKAELPIYLTSAKRNNDFQVFSHTFTA